ncbi:hypothetical protein B0J15DRAFT_473679 [Fusarium solani]|uniref:Uncharacterized protein n=1 Tax=Fusarium solani TaxID=169388 RepID=A0A9P9L6F8_FUSSL|nr:uncharacterized protein B0J15DRAFT_473679 [Fusarium solani]KAH7274803.1 hypothetical protein B0J15DRAFT_473679 [Fusarium solani]
MPTTYTIVFANEHGSGGQYVFCMEKPIINNDPTAGNVITNASIGQYVSDGSDFTLTTQIQFNAWCGKLPSQPVDSTTSPQGHSEAVELGTNKNDGDALTMVLDDGSVTFDKAKAKTAPTGCFTVAQPTGFNASDNLAFGLAQKDNTDSETPKSIIPADQNMTTNVQPVVKFFVLKVKQGSSDGVNYQSFSTKPGVVDFTTGDGQGLYTARVVHEKNGDFTVTYK